MTARDSTYFAAGVVTGSVLFMACYMYSQRRKLLVSLEEGPTTQVQVAVGSGLHQQAVLQQVVPPAAIHITWEDIAGLDDLVVLIQHQVIYPMRSTLARRDPLTLPPKGVLLHGPPGCGKTMVAKAIANDINAVFINFDISSIKNKFVGETEKMMAALFSTAHQLQPAVIFIDEADAFLGTRRETDIGTEITMKAQFLTLWDGLITDASAQVLVLAATNRPDAIDPAILRRLPVQFQIPFPEKEQRLRILCVTLRQSDVSPDVDLEVLADLCEGFSGSDIFELCRYAAITRLVRQTQGHSCSGSSWERRDSLDPLTMEDFLDALNHARDKDDRQRPPSHMYM